MTLRKESLSLGQHSKLFDAFRERRTARQRAELPKRLVKRVVKKILVALGLR